MNQLDLKAIEKAVSEVLPESMVYIGGKSISEAIKKAVMTAIAEYDKQRTQNPNSN